MDTRLTRGFLFADLRDYTRYVEDHGDRAAVVLLAEYRDLVRRCVAQFGGAEIRTEGDSFYVVFPSASQAVECGLAITEAAQTPSASDDHAPIRVGIGIHAGETVEGAEGYVGSAVNIASRVAARAAAGEVLVTDTVRNLTRTSLPVAYLPRGRARLKGISERIPLYAAAPSVGASVMVVRRSGTFPRLPPTRWGGTALAVVGGATVSVVGAVVLFNLLHGSEHTGNAAGLGLGPSTSASAAAVLASGIPGEIAAVTQRPSGSFGGIVLLDLATRRVTSLTSDPSDRDPAWSPDGQRLAFVRGAGVHKALYVLDMSSGVAQRMAGAATVQVLSPDWNPRGGSIAFIDCCSNGGGGNVMIFDLGSKSATPVRGPIPSLKGFDSMLEPSGLSWGRQGIAVSFQTYPNSNLGLQPSRIIWVINPDTGEWDEVAGGTGPSDVDEPAWSPSGDSIAFSGYPPGANDRDIFLLTPSNSPDPIDLTNSPGMEWSPTWSPDGVWIAYSEDRGHGAQLQAFRVNRPSDVRVLTADPALSYLEPAWRP